MQVFRGPSSTDFSAESHELVAEVAPDQLEECISSKALVRFNITKDGQDRRSVCHIHFDDADIVALHRGLLSRFQVAKSLLRMIESTTKKHDLSAEDQIREIQKGISLFRQ